MSKTVLSVGQCGFDHSSISKVCSEFHAQTVNISSLAELQSKLKNESPALILINRILDLDGSSGLDIIKTLKNDEKTKNIPVMLVSNYPASQAEAVSLGALEGFGKNDLYTKNTKEKLSEFLK